MPQTYAQGSIAGVSLTVGDPLRALIQDGAQLQPHRHVNQRHGADGTVYTQALDVGSHGRRFGVEIAFVPVATLQAIITAVNAALDTNAAFNVTLQDDFQTINADCTVDGSDWLSYPSQITNTEVFRDVLMRFITV